jgi:uncharacterized protein (UPF0261 family)
MNIAVIGTLDTKGIEVDLMVQTIARFGHMPIVLDPGILGKPTIAAHVTRETIALAGGESLADLLMQRDKAHAQGTMIRGLIAEIKRLYEGGELQGVVAVGGAQGTAIATAAMRALPVGIPKVMLSTVACGKATFGPYVGTKDITMIHSVTDIAGLNRVVRRLIIQAAAAVVAMAAVPEEPVGLRETIAITQTGITTPGVTAVKERLESLGFEVMAFHANGIGTQAMEELVLAGMIAGVIDFSPHDVIDLLFDGLMPAMPGRMTAAGQMKIPLIVAPGCTDIRLHGLPDELPSECIGRPFVRHSPIHTHVRTTPSEMSAVAHWIAERLNAGAGPRAALVPLRGFSMLNRDGEILYDRDANMGYVETLRRELSSEVRLVEVDAHINDDEFAQATVDAFVRLMDARSRVSISPPLP